MPKSMKLTKNLINKAKKETGWEFGNKILYDMCRKYPYHLNREHIIAKFWLIGRAYAAAIERRKTANESNDIFYTEKVAPVIQKSKIDEWLKGLNKLKHPTYENIRNILIVHKNLVNLIKELTGMEKRSLSSKYLHFHKPHLFFIHDSRAVSSIRKFTTPAGNKMDFNEDIDIEYAKFFLRCLKLRDEIKTKFDMHLAPRELDNILLEGFE